MSQNGEITVRAKCRACDVLVTASVPAAMPLRGLATYLGELHDQRADGHCIAAPRALLVAFGSDPRVQEFRRDEAGGL